eukprot:1160963-Pelagomonas_calceolata.AAC.20
MDITGRVKVNDMRNVRHIKTPGSDAGGHHDGRHTVTEALDGLIAGGLQGRKGKERKGFHVCACPGRQHSWRRKQPHASMKRRGEERKGFHSCVYPGRV